MQDPFTWEPGLSLSSRVRSTFGLGLESGVHSLGVALGYRMETSLGTPASRDWIWTRFGPKSLVQTVFQRRLEKASWEAAVEYGGREVDG